MTQIKGVSKYLKIFGFGKESVPDDAIELHNKKIREITPLAQKIVRMDDEKFTNKEFSLYVKIRIKVETEAQEYQQVCRSIKYLEVAIAASGSYLKTEQTELRYRSRKQQEFYQFVIDNITDDVNKNAFRDRLKNKLDEILPSINSEEGKAALKTYLVEINKISQYDLGLKLLSLFKKYELSDFTILRKVSDLVEKTASQDLLTANELKLTVIENYEDFEKLAPIVGISDDNLKPELFVQMLQYLGLGRKHEKSYSQFQSLIEAIKKWRKSYKSINIIRQQYHSEEYNIPKEFYTTIPGENIYHKYKTHLNKKK